MPTKVASVIICDDIRKEINNKDILIGVYGGNIVVPSYPATIRLAIWIELEPESIGKTHWNLKVDTPSGNPPLEVEFDIDVREPATVNFAMGGIPLRMERDGEVVVHLKEGDHDWKMVKRKKVLRAPLPSN